MPLTGGDNNPLLIPPLQLAGGNAGQLHDFVTVKAIFPGARKSYSDAMFYCDLQLYIKQKFC